MKKLFLLAFAAGLFAACNNNASDNADSTNISTDQPVIEETAPLPADTSLTTDSTALNSHPGAPNPAPTPGTDSASPNR